MVQRTYTGDKITQTNLEPIMNKQFEDMQAMTKDGYQAVLASAQAVTKGMQTLTQEATDFSKTAFDKSTAVFEQASALKSFDKVLEVQQGYAKEAYEAFVSQATKMSEMYVATAKEAYKPFEAGFAAFGIKAPK
jgi:hypothetical protein